MQREYPLRDVFNGLRFTVKTGNQWHLMSHDLPPWYVDYQQMRRWIEARCFETMVEDPCITSPSPASSSQTWSEHSSKVNSRF